MDGSNTDPTEVDDSLGMVGTEHTTSLNLAGAIGYTLSLRDLIRIFNGHVKNNTSTHYHQSTTNSTTPPIEPSTSSKENEPQVLDNWEDYFDLEESSSSTHPFSKSVLQTITKSVHFKNLTHLSLAYPNPTVSTTFPDLLNFTKDSIPTLTHLSLAGWPTPVTGVMTLSIAERASSNLKRLSRNLICLRYLDVSDCDSHMYIGLESVDWAGCWRNVGEVVARQGEALSAKGVRILEQRILSIVALKETVRGVRKERGGGRCVFTYEAVED